MNLKTRVEQLESHMHDCMQEFKLMMWTPPEAGLVGVECEGIRIFREKDEDTELFIDRATSELEKQLVQGWHWLDYIIEKIS